MALAWNCPVIGDTILTMDAINQYILGLGADGLETDIRQTSDGVYVMHHASTVTIDTDSGETKAVADMTYNELLTVEPTLMTLDEMSRVQAENDFFVVYELYIDAANHAENIISMLIQNGVDLRKTFFDTKTLSDNVYFVQANKNANVIYKGADATEENFALAATLLTGLNRVWFSVPYTITNEELSVLHSYGVGACSWNLTASYQNDPATFATLDLDQINTTANGGLAKLVSARNSYREREPEYTPFEILTDVANAIRTVTGTSGKLDCTQLSNAIRKMSYTTE